MAFLDDVFNRAADPESPPTIIRTRALLRALACAAPIGGREGGVVGDPDDPDAAYLFRNCIDGETFELGVVSRRPDGRVFSSYVKAERVGMDAFDIKAIVLDNEPQALDNDKEIRALLDFIGDQVREIYRERLPGIHCPFGRFSPLGRLITRLRPARYEPGLGLF